MISQTKLDALLANAGDLCLKRRAKLMIEALDPQANDRILDVGCGDGFYLFLLSRLGRFNLVGIDNNPDSIVAAKRLVSDKRVRFVTGDVTRSAFRNGSFNKIICSEVIEHLDSDVEGLRVLHRLLKKGGKIYITVPHLNYPFFWDPINWVLQHTFGTHIKSGLWAGIWNMHDRLYTMDQLVSVVKKSGFKIEKKKYLTHYSLPFNHIILYIGFRMRTSPRLSKSAKNSMSKFKPSRKKTWFSYVLSFMNWLDKRNDREIRADESSVGLFLEARK